MNCAAEQIVIGAGNEYLELLLAQVLGEKKTVLMDDPTYLQAYRTFSNMGYLVKNIPAEQGSMPIEAVRRENADILYVMPSHQFPLGTVMPLKQRLELLKWASEKEGRYLIEDDHDSEYRYKGKPIPSLQSIDHEEKVIYLGTFSKALHRHSVSVIWCCHTFVKKLSELLWLLFHNCFKNPAGSFARIYPWWIFWKTSK